MEEGPREPRTINGYSRECHLHATYVRVGSPRAHPGGPHSCVQCAVASVGSSMASHTAFELLSVLVLLAAPVSGLAPPRHATTTTCHQSPRLSRPSLSRSLLSAKACGESADGADALASQAGESYSRASPVNRCISTTPRTRRELVGFSLVGGLGAIGMLAPPVAAFENAIPDYAK